jgi:hypothetical protein
MENLKIKFIKWLIAVFLPGYSLHHNPGKGKKMRAVLDGALATSALAAATGRIR